MAFAPPSAYGLNAASYLTFSCPVGSYASNTSKIFDDALNRLPLGGLNEGAGYLSYLKVLINEELKTSLKLRNSALSKK